MDSEADSQGLSLANILGDEDAIERAQAGVKETSDDWEKVDKEAAEGYCIECEG